MHKGKIKFTLFFILYLNMEHWFRMHFDNAMSSGFAIFMTEV
jgi:hypothetical protein